MIASLPGKSTSDTSDPCVASESSNTTMIGLSHLGRSRHGIIRPRSYTPMLEYTENELPGSRAPVKVIAAGDGAGVKSIEPVLFINRKRLKDFIVLCVVENDVEYWAPFKGPNSRHLKTK